MKSPKQEHSKIKKYTIWENDKLVNKVFITSNHYFRIFLSKLFLKTIIKPHFCCSFNLIINYKYGSIGLMDTSFI